jgi:Carboxypeptidase regulatory-like domain
MRGPFTLAVAAGSAFLLACGGQDGGSTTPSSPTPTSRTFTLSGQVTEALQTNPIAGARVSIGDGPNAGRSATTDTSGSYSLSGLQPSGFTVSASADGYQPRSQAVDLTSDKTLNFGLDRSGPRTQFGSGQFLVGTDILPGRYFSDPVDGCYWERESGLGGGLADILANNLIEFDAPQWIVDIPSSDVAFKTESECGTWFNSPRAIEQGAIRPGVWLVNSQVSPGRYRADVSPNCYWERLRNFEGTIDAVIANDFITSAGPHLVDIQSSDAGFHADAECGTWTRVSGSVAASTADAEPSAADIERFWRMRRQRHNLGRRR